jgi:hypothetical protein
MCWTSVVLIGAVSGRRKSKAPKKLEDVAATAAMEDNSGCITKKSSSPGTGWEVVSGSRNAKLVADLFPAVSQTAKINCPSPEKAVKTINNTGAGKAMLDFLKKREQPESNDDSSTTKKESSPYDRDACKKEISLAVAELRASHEVNEAIARIGAIAVPKQEQPSELVDLLSAIMEEGSESTRKVCFGLISGLFSKGHWKSKSLNKGLQIFIKETCPDLKFDVPNLPRIVRDEMHPLLAPLVEANVLDADQHKALIAGF